MRLHPFGRGPLLAIASAAAWLGLLPVLAGLATGFALGPLTIAYAAGLVGYCVTAWWLRDAFELDSLVRAMRRRRQPRVHGRHAVHASAGASAGRP
jgi:hypothetical protein